MNPDRSLIWVHIICNEGYQSLYVDGLSNINCGEWQEKGEGLVE